MSGQNLPTEQLVEDFSNLVPVIHPQNQQQSQQQMLLSYVPNRVSRPFTLSSDQKNQDDVVRSAFATFTAHATATLLCSLFLKFAFRTLYSYCSRVRLRLHIEGDQPVHRPVCRHVRQAALGSGGGQGTEVAIATARAAVATSGRRWDAFKPHRSGPAAGQRVFGPISQFQAGAQPVGSSSHLLNRSSRFARYACRFGHVYLSPKGYGGATQHDFGSLPLLL